MNVHKDEYALKVFLAPLLTKSAELIRCRAVWRPSTCFSNPIGSLSFHPIIPKFGVNVHYNIAPKDAEEKFSFLLLVF